MPDRDIYSECRVYLQTSIIITLLCFYRAYSIVSSNVKINPSVPSVINVCKSDMFDAIAIQNNYKLFTDII